MKTNHLLTVISICSFGLIAQSQNFQLKKITTNEAQVLKRNATLNTRVPFNDLTISRTKVSKEAGSNEKDRLLSNGTPITSNGKICTPYKVAYNISSDKLTPINMTMGIKLGNVYDLNKFRQGNYSPINYNFNGDALISVGGSATSNQEQRRVQNGTSNLDFLLQLNEFTHSVNNQYMSQRMSQIFHLVYGTSAFQLNAKLGIGYSDEMGNEANINTRLDLSSVKHKYTMLYKEENYYEELEMLGENLMFPTVPNPNLVYVSRIIYGKLGFFEYESKKDFMGFKLNADGTYNQEGMSFSADIGLATITSDTEGEITARLFGSTSDSNIPMDKQGFIDWINQRPSTNAVVPVGFVLKFVNDNSPAYFITSGSDGIEICTPIPPAENRYDVKITLKKIKVNQVCEAPFDDKEELWGKQAVTYAKTTSNGRTIVKVNEDRILWNISENEAKNSEGFGVNEYDDIVKSTEIKNLTYEELKNLEIWIGGKIYDYEATGSREYNCLECTKPRSYSYKRIFRINGNSRMDEINRLIINEDYKNLNIGNDKIMELNYEEGIAICKSKIQAQYNIAVKIH